MRVKSSYAFTRSSIHSPIFSAPLRSTTCAGRKRPPSTIVPAERLGLQRYFVLIGIPKKSWSNETNTAANGSVPVGEACSLQRQLMIGKALGSHAIRLKIRTFESTPLHLRYVWVPSCWIWDACRVIVSLRLACQP